MFFRKKKSVPPRIVPDPGQKVRLLGWGTSGRAEVRAVSEPFTDARGQIVVRVTEEQEYKDASREGRRAIGILWPVQDMEIPTPSEALNALEKISEGTEGAEEDASENVGGLQMATKHASWWRRLFGLE